MSCEKGKSEGDDVSVVPMSCIVGNKASCKRLWCSNNKYWRTLNIFNGILLGLLLGGAGVFNALEGPSEMQRIDDARLAYNESLTNFTQLLVNQTNLTEMEAMALTDQLVKLGRRINEADATLATEDSPIWDWSSAVFFCVTVITTIGYGTIAPVTAGGQIFFLFYAVIGIPIALLFLAAVGDIIKAWVDRAMRPVDKRYGPIASRLTGTLSLFLFTLIFYILIPAGIFSAIEGWNYRESVYYATVTLTTVGFGDFVPAVNVNTSRAVRGLYKIMSAFWIWIGLALVATIIIEMQSFFKAFGEWWFSPRNFLCRCCHRGKECSGCSGGELQQPEKGDQLRDGDKVPASSDF